MHWAVVGHLQDRGDGLPVIRGVMRTFTGDMPDNLKGPQDWALLAVLAAAPAFGWLSRDPRWGMFRASLLYGFALTLGHGRYYVLPFTAGLIVAAHPGRLVWLIPVYVVEFLLPLTRDLLWVMRSGAVFMLALWPMLKGAVALRSPADRPDSAR